MGKSVELVNSFLLSYCQNFPKSLVKNDTSENSAIRSTGAQLLITYDGEQLGQFALMCPKWFQKEQPENVCWFSINVAD